MPMFRSTGFTWKERPIWGNAVAMIVPSKFSIKNAPATRMAIEVELAEGSGDSLIFQQVFRSEQENYLAAEFSSQLSGRLNLTLNSSRRDGVSSSGVNYFYYF